ncbi:MAG: OmpH family outer membrane protein [bacterium]
MKKIFIIISFLFIAGFQNSFAQLKIGYVDSDAIMTKLPDALDAQQKIDAFVQEWQEEIDKMQREWKSKYEDYEKRKLIMSDERRADTEKELVALEKQITDYRQKKFGVNGELFTKQDELMKPVQNRIFNAIQDVAKENEYDYVFDRSGDIVFLYTKEEYDVTNLVLEKLQ